MIKKLKSIKNILIILSAILFLNNNVVFSKSLADLNYSFFAEGGETETVFIIDGRSFPVKVGSVGLKAAIKSGTNSELYAKAGFGYSQKQSVSAYDYNLSGSVFSTSMGLGASRKFPIQKSNFAIVPFVDLTRFNYSSDTFRGDQSGNLIKANVKGDSAFYRAGAELQYATQNGYFFFGSGLNNWDISNEISIKTSNLVITPRVWADRTDKFFQAGVVFDTGNSDAVLGMRVSDLTFDLNTQLIEIFAEVKVSFGN